MRKLWPGQNLFFFRRILDGIEGVVGRATGADDAPEEGFVETITTLQQREEQEEAEAAEESTTSYKVAGLVVGAIALGLLARRGNVVDLRKLVKPEAPEFQAAVRPTGTKVPKAPGPPPGKAVSKAEFAAPYGRINEMLRRLGVNKPDATVSMPIADMVKVLNKIVPKDDPYRMLVDKFVKADMPGNIYFGGQDFMTEAAGAGYEAASKSMYGAYFRNGLTRMGIEGTDHVVMNLDVTAPQQMGWILMHEIGHAATVRGMRDDDTARNLMQELLERAKAHEGMPKSHYGYEDEFEFTSEGWGNLEFQQLLKKNGLWEQFLQISAMVFGITGAALATFEHVMTVPESADQI
jgi:hypothetical protein